MLATSGLTPCRLRLIGLIPKNLKVFFNNKNRKHRSVNYQAWEKILLVRVGAKLRRAMHHVGPIFMRRIAFSGSILLALACLLGTAAAQDQPSLQNSVVEPPSRSETDCPFKAGNWVLSGYASAAVGKSSHQVYAGHVGLGYHFTDCLSLNLEAIGYLVDHARKSGGGGIGLVPRWHFLVRDKWSLYLDGGWGFVYTRDTLRDPGTHFNFTVQAGPGATYRFSDRFNAMMGYRWFHVSNARIRGKNRNVGFDSPMLYLGVMSIF